MRLGFSRRISLTAPLAYSTTTTSPAALGLSARTTLPPIRWMPHSSLFVPRQRPARGSSPMVGSDTGTRRPRVSITASPATLGRTPENAVAVSHPLVSRVHLAFEWSPGGWARAGRPRSAQRDR